MDADEHGVVRFANELCPLVLVSFFSLGDRRGIVRVGNLRAVARHDDFNAGQFRDGAGAQRDLQVNICLNGPVWRHCPAVLPAVTSVKDQDLLLIGPVCGRFRAPELPVGSEPAAKHHDQRQQHDQNPLIE